MVLPQKRVHQVWLRLVYIYMCIYIYIILNVTISEVGTHQSDLGLLSSLLPRQGSQILRCNQAASLRAPVLETSNPLSSGLAVLQVPGHLTSIPFFLGNGLHGASSKMIFSIPDCLHGTSWLQTQSATCNQKPSDKARKLFHSRTAPCAGVS